MVFASASLVARCPATGPCARRERVPLWQQRTTVFRSRFRSLATAVGRAGGFEGSGDDKEGDVEQLTLSILPEQFRERGKSLMAWLFNARAPKYAWRTLSALILGGEVMVRILQGKIHYRNTLDQLNVVGPKSLGVCLLTSAFVGMVFTIQFIREFAKLGLTKSVGGVLALALGRELTPVVTCIIIAGRVGSAFAAELGSQQVSEQTDSLRGARFGSGRLSDNASRTGEHDSRAGAQPAVLHDGHGSERVSGRGGVRGERQRHTGQRFASHRELGYHRQYD